MKGICNCGSVRFDVSEDITKLYQCHCRLCQKQSGSTSNTATIVHESDFKWLSGLDSITHWKKESGFTSDFCSTCGSPVPNRLRDMNVFWVPMGLVGDLEAKVVTHLCSESKARWDTIQGEAVIFDGMPESMEQFIASLQ